MNEKKPNSLIPMPQRATTVYSGGNAAAKESLNENQQEFHTREDVRQFLPDILGKVLARIWICLLYTSPSPRDLSTSRMPSSA